MVDVRCPYLVGREPELERLRTQLAAARDGHGAVVFITGEPGVGKSRLAKELADQARRERAIVVAGRAVPSATDVAYRPVAEALAQAMRGRDLPDDPALTPWLPALGVVLPVLSPGLAAVESSAHTCGEALVRVLRWVRGDQPLVIALEDLHWADPDTLGVVEYLCDNLTAEPILCLATVRSEPDSPARQVARRVGQRDPASQLPLDRLADGAVAEMVTACQPAAADELVARVQSTADGVPLLVEEMLATPGVPASIDEAVHTRIAEFTEDDRSVLYAAAVLGRHFDWQLLPAITGRSVEQVTAVLERMVAAMLVVVDGGQFQFRHAMTREAVVASLVPPRRAAVARAALTALDAAHPEHDHADLALQAGDRARAGELLACSGRASLRRGALGTAVEALRRAVDLLGPVTGTDSQAALVEALALAGRPDEALAVGEQLLARLGAGDATTVTVHIELARAAVAATRWPTAVTHLDAAKGLLAARPDPRLTAQVDVLAAEVALAADDLAQTRAAAHRALATAESIGAPEIGCHALELIGRSHRVHDLAAAREAFTKAHQTADAAGLPVWRLRAEHELGTIELLDHAGTDRLLAARQAAERLGVYSTAVVLDIQLAAAHHLHFDLAAARARVDQAIDRSRRLGLGRLHATALLFDACTSALAGDRAATAAGVAATLRAAPDDTELAGLAWAGGTGMLEALWGERAAALSAMDRGMAALHSVANSAPGPYRGLWALLHAVGRHPEAAGRIARVRRSGVTVMRPNRGYLHYAEAVLARSVDAVAAGDAELGYFPVYLHIGRSLLAEAALAEQWGTPQQWLREARECFEAHGLHHLARHCGELLGEPPRWRPAGTTAREEEVLRLVAEGLANKQIAARLHLSVRTVEKHVESLLRKAGASSRTQLVAMVRETT